MKIGCLVVMVALGVFLLSGVFLSDDQLPVSDAASARFRVQIDRCIAAMDGRAVATADDLECMTRAMDRMCLNEWQGEPDDCYKLMRDAIQAVIK